MRVGNLRIECNVLHYTIEMTWDEFGKFLLWKQVENGMTYEECSAWLDRDYPDVKPKLSTVEITEGDPEMIGRKLWCAMPPTITMTVRFE
jgi:hypothetical protein